MTRGGPLEWLTGAGWLVLVGGGDFRLGETAEIDDRLLARADFSQPVAFVSADVRSLSGGQELLDYYASLGGPQGYVVPILDAADARRGENRRLLAEAGLILLGGEDGASLAQVLQGSLALGGMVEAFVGGALVVGMGAGAAPLGEWVIVAGTTAPGWGWVDGVAVVPHFAGTAAEPDLQMALRTRRDLGGLGIPERTALALGPAGQVETWGEGEVTVVVPR